MSNLDAETWRLKAISEDEAIAAKCVPAKDSKVSMSLTGSSQTDFVAPSSLGFSESSLPRSQLVSMRDDSNTSSNFAVFRAFQNSFIETFVLKDGESHVLNLPRSTSVDVEAMYCFPATKPNTVTMHCQRLLATLSEEQIGSARLDLIRERNALELRATSTFQTDVPSFSANGFRREGIWKLP